MARPNKETVDYFPHFVKDGRTIYILENKFKNDGYAFWFKLLEILGDCEGLFYDCSIMANWEYLLAKTHVANQTAEGIIKTLISLGQIDAELWDEKRVIWVENLAKNLTGVYKMRKLDVPTRPCLLEDKPLKEEINHDENRQGLVEESQGLVKKPHGVEVNCDENRQGLVKKPLEVSKETQQEKKSKVNISKVIEEKEIYKEKEKTPYQEEIVSLWNEICGVKLPKVTVISESRKKKIKLRLIESGARGTDATMLWAKTLFTKIAESSFLCGDNGCQWRANFDWVFDNSTNWVKILEGNYDNGRAQPYNAKDMHSNGQILHTEKMDYTRDTW